MKFKKVVGIYPTPDGRYRAKLRKHDGRITSKNFRTKTDAEAFARAVKKGEDLSKWIPEVAANLNKGTYGTFSFLAQRFLESREVTRSTLSNYKSQIKYHIAPVLGERVAEELNLTDYQELNRRLRDTKAQTCSYMTARRNACADEVFEPDEFISTNYRREILSLTQSILKWGKKFEYISRNPFEDAELPTKERQPFDYWSLRDEDEFLSWLEAGGFYEVERNTPRGDGRHVRKMAVRNADVIRDIVLFALRSGMRKGEIAALKPEHVNLNEGYILVRSTVRFKTGRVSKTTKNGRFRYLELNDDMRDILMRRWPKNEKKPFFSLCMNRIKNFPELCKLAGVKPIHFHGLRHTNLTNLANGYGMDRPIPLPQVMQWAGHSHIETTMLYVHTDNIRDSGSRQWSRAERMARVADEMDVADAQA